MRVADVMTSPVVTVTGDTTLREAARLMLDHGVGGLPVIDAGERPVGILTEADYVSREAGRSPQGRRRLLGLFLDKARPDLVTVERVRDAMTKEPVVIGPGAPVTEAARLMMKVSVKRLPVVDGAGRLVGIVSRRDILKAFVRPDAEIREDVDRVVGRLLRGDEPVTVSVSDGVVRLEGEVDSRTDADVLTEILERLDGVVKVDSALTWRVDERRPGSPWAPYAQEGAGDSR